jgi:hypothetical protein
VNFNTLLGLSYFLAFAIWSVGVQAAPLDKSANAKIDEAINVHYLSTNFDKAEGLLLGTLKACGERCSEQVKARAWMYVGIVRGAGKQDTEGAAAAFSEAVALDPDVKLDRDLATEEVQALFAASTSDGASTTEEVPLEATPDTAGDVVAASMECSPELLEVETRRPIPITCKTPTPASRVTLMYKGYGASKWSQVSLGKSADAWVGQIPCSGTGIQGALSWYVKATSTSGKVLDSFGSESEPLTVEMVASTSVPPPALPGKEAPARCVDPADCPEEMRGTPACPGTVKADASKGNAGWGDSCRVHGDCGDGLYCADGTCESPPSCDTDEDCSGGTCQDSLCSYPDGDADEESDDDGTEPPQKTFFGLIIALDLAHMDGTGVCNPVLSGDDYECYVAETIRYSAPAVRADNTLSPYHNPASGSPAYSPGRSGQISSSLAPSSVRILAAVERVFTSKLTGEGRVGLSIGGPPGRGIGSKIHLGARGKYWFSGLGKGLRLFGTVGAGLGQVDGQAGVTVQDFQADGGPLYQSYAQSNSPYCVTSDPQHCQLPATAFKKLGPAFVGAGLGAYYNLGGHGPVLEVTGQVMLPTTGLVIQPAGGWMVGF